MNWDYANLSKAAKEAGGPAEYVKTLVDFGRNTGHKDMIPVVLISLAVGCAGGLASKIFYDRSKYAKIKDKEASEKLTQGIKEYDETHISDEEKTDKQ